MRKKVKYAKLHDLNVVVPGVGTLASQLPMPNKTLRLEMFYTDNALEVNVNGVSCGIPLANVQFVIFDTSENEASSIKAA